MRQLFWWSAFVALAVVALAEDEVKNPKLISAFQIVRFANDHCIGSNSKNGTCYTKEECEDKGGTESGSCADGFGVCCTLSIGCGRTSNFNVTYFTTQRVTGQCAAKICPCSENICRLRLDLDTFVITGPSTISASQIKQLAGEVTMGGTKAIGFNGICQTDSFTVSAPAGGNIPTICGTMTGQHLYVDSSPDCNDVTFQLAPTATSPATLAARNWNIKVTQIPCTDENLPPHGCQQWFYGGNAGTIQSYNWQGEHHLANQFQKSCIRRERGTCRICYAAANTDFVVSGAGNVPKGINAVSSCCGYGVAGVGLNGFDCVVIPGASKEADGTPVPPQICGRSAGLVSVDMGTTGVTVCSRHTPFELSFFTDGFEHFEGAAIVHEVPAKVNNKGFQIAYKLTGTNC